MDEEHLSAFGSEVEPTNLAGQAQDCATSSEGGDTERDSVKDAAANLAHSIKSSAKAKNGRVVLIIAIAIVAIALLAVGAISLKSCTATPEERYATDVAKDYRSMLKDPDSMTIRGDFTVVHKTYDNGEEGDFCYFTVSAKNGLGGTAMSVPFYKGDTYVMDVSEDLDEDEYDLHDEEEWGDFADLALTRLTWAYWNMGDFSENEEAVTIDGESIARAIGASYSE